MGSLLLALLLASAAPEPPTLELRGRIEPPPPKALVAIYGAYSPFTAVTNAGPDGKFRFRNLPAGTYTLMVSVSAQGEVQQTIVVTPTLADANGRVEVTVPFRPVSGTKASGATISLGELATPDSARSAYARAQEALRKQNVEEAIKHLQRAVEEYPKFSAAWNNLGTIAYHAQKYEEAEKYFRKALDADASQYAPLVNLGGVLLNLKRPKEALEFNRRAIHERPDDALANSQLGISYFWLKDYDSALKYLRLAKELDPAHFSKPQLLLAQIYLQRNEPENAVAELEDFIARHPDAPEVPEIRKKLEAIKAR
ncbi:MAG TPA: tetratricopeptide repeat protein [Bryobacteraceae bacterium]|nr:tetratricopeptide repeat protein [Bryobacteraceae bacterium]HOQ46468.1 tetratricopeptide repeat protein [Bryobacteraceae bacterium]HPU72627.1 tetratricopeptide repeat protein [Bryobacteraceae bacterium]